LKERFLKRKKRNVLIGLFKKKKRISKEHKKKNQQKDRMTEILNDRKRERLKDRKTK
jgi:hypothetical protein